MVELKDASLLRIFLSEDDLHGSQQLHEEILRVAHAKGIAGATVFRGVGGYGPTSLRQQYFQFRTEGHTLVIEIIDTEEKIEAFLPIAGSMLITGAITVEKVKVFVKP